MNATSKSTLQALGYGLAGAAAAAIANETARRVNPRPSPLSQLAQMANLNFLGRRKRFSNPFGKGSIGGALLNNPLFYNLGGERNVKRNLLRSALLGVGAGLGTLAIPRQKRNFWGASAGREGSRKKTIGRLIAGGLIAAAASKLLNRSLRDRRHHHHDGSAHEHHSHEQHVHEQIG